MPENSHELLSSWHKRWEADSTRVKDILDCLRKDPPEKAAQRIVSLGWYSSKNGFYPLTVSPNKPAHILDLRGIPLRGQNLENIVIPFALLDEADLFKVNLTGADLSFVRARGASFHEAILEEATLVAAHLGGADLSMARLNGADLSRARLNGADLGWAELGGAALVSASLEGAVLEKVQAEQADFSGAVLVSANFSMARCPGANFEGANLRGARFMAAHLERAHLSGADLESADLSLSYFDDASLVSADLKGANLSNCQLLRANLFGADLRDADLSGSTLDGAVMTAASLNGVKLDGASLEGADLNEADLTESSLRETSLVRANLSGADLRRADLTNCRFRSQAGAALVDGDTRFGYISPKPDDPTVAGWLIPPLSRLSKADRDEIDFDKSESLSRQVRLLYRDSGFAVAAAGYYEQECYWQTRSLRARGVWWKFLPRLAFFECFTGYGEKPGRVVLTGLSLIILFALLFLFSGVEAGGRLIDYGLFSGYVSMGTFISDFWTCLLLSVQCFSTLGLGLLRPVAGFSHAMATLEGLVGFFVITLAIVTYVRKAARN
jgi:uncharacterized protein YjbI with pentapeptide repeats